ncbi:hypothetical protein G6O69_07615 [Pseudenhygromyxa sp. WMMC2535]|uniref:ATP-grasp domain-containing protein n=1 Tax=Pseudenhygromyxa sp. WMMC2535 TaxID=2712867 RepID=UPI00155376ED|nr:hypothetical protein [Pseudenhygromyxa sp. WMMC2535]NVB37696.1 hypothetical protein [Pseudenhygromyxa sp. WMMC2535]
MTRSPRLALATCANLPDWEVDDRPLHAALARRGASVEQPCWDDPEVDWASFDAVVIRTTWDYQHRCQDFVRWAEAVEARTRLFNPAAVVAWNTDKRYLRELGERGVALAPSLWLEPGEAVDLRAAVADFASERAFFKPVVGASAVGTRRFSTTDADELAAAAADLDAHLAAGEAMILQPYLASVEDQGELSVLVYDGEPCYGVRKIPVPGDYRVQDDYGASDEPWQPDEAARELVARSLAALGQRIRELGGRDEALLYARVDMLRDHEGALVLNELELVEPSLFFRHDPRAGEGFADALLRRL